jgi:hypothetical protein
MQRARIIEGFHRAVAKQLSNRVAVFTSVPLQMNRNSSLGDRGLGNRHLLSIRSVIPVSIGDESTLISRTLIPFAAQSDVHPGRHSSVRLGDRHPDLFYSHPRSLWAAGSSAPLRRCCRRRLRVWRARSRSCSANVRMAMVALFSDLLGNDRAKVVGDGGRDAVIEGLRVGRRRAAVIVAELA